MRDKNSKTIRGFLKDKVSEPLENPQTLRKLPQKAADVNSSVVNIADISQWPQRIKNAREAKDKEILRIMYLLLSVEKEIPADKLVILEQIAAQFGNSCKVEYSEIKETCEKLQEVHKNNSFEEFFNVFIDEIKDGCADIQKGLIGLTNLSLVRRAYVIWIVAALSVNAENYPELRQLLERLSVYFKPTRIDVTAKTAIFGKENDNYWMKLLKQSTPITRVADAVVEAVKYDSENQESYIKTDFIQAVENDCKLIINLGALVETEKNPEIKKKIEESIEQITAYLLDRISPHDVSREFYLD